jgi:hypothetical protein
MGQPMTVMSDLFGLHFPDCLPSSLAQYRINRMLVEVEVKL